MRSEARRIRKAIPEETRAEKSRLVAERFLALPELRSARGVACYVGHKSEVATTFILRSLLAQGTLVATPVLVPHRDVGDAEPRSWRMRFVRLDHPWALEPGAFGIPEPRQPWTEVDVDALDVIAVPGLRFGRDGSRLGNGGGHFDRLLAQHPQPRRVGLAFAEQMVAATPGEPHDMHMDVIVTDAETLRVPRPA